MSDAPKITGVAVAEIPLSGIVVYEDLARLEFDSAVECRAALKSFEAAGGKVVWSSTPCVTPKGSSHVYFILCPAINRIKIGYSASILHRIEHHRTSCPFPIETLRVVPGGARLERKLHERFKSIRLHLEWFDATPELVHFIKTFDPAAFGQEGDSE